ncbi:peptide-N-glycosidase F-related protein [Bizionia sediminis]|uniref:Peptide-N-glycosidase F-related protein n=1 Tax=Bizionia sediminis TaxID=1737064 RepID=A0ABW5KXD8_9FLAO
MNVSSKFKVLALLALVLTLFYCSSDDASEATKPDIGISATITNFGDIPVLSVSDAQTVAVTSTNLTADLRIEASANFEISSDNSTFLGNLTIPASDANAGSKTLYVRFAPGNNAIGAISGTVQFKSSGAATKTINVVGTGVSITPFIVVNPDSLDFGDVTVNQISDARAISVNGDNLETDITVITTAGFAVSLDDVTFGNSVQISAENANNETIIYVRYEASNVGEQLGTLTVQNQEADNVSINLRGTGLPVVYNYQTFNGQRLAFGGGYNQSATQTFNLHPDVTNIETVKMYVKLRCPAGGCDEWDVYANVKVLDNDSGELYEIGRYITPYWNDNSQLPRGFEFDVTDFKSLLTGATELRIRTECWNADGYEVSVDFDFIEGTPDYPYYAVSRVLNYDDWSSSGVPYGVSHSFDLDKTISIPGNAESTHLRTIISGWGHATPYDAGGRGCAEWCYRTHSIKIDGANTFDHYMGPLGCASNPVNNQNPGNWRPDRAGWCPGMAVPVRTDTFNSSMAGSTFNFEYDYEDWTTDGQSGNAFYATSTFVVVKSNTPISKPTVTD